jgi:hypothetical protein
VIRAEELPPADDWPGLLLSGGLTAIASGLIAGLVAYLTVHWTQERGKEAARLVASQAAALVMQRQTKAAADLMWSALQVTRLTEAMNAHSEWRQELPFQQPVITDPALVRALERYEQVVLALDAAALQVREAPGAFSRDPLGNPVASEDVTKWCHRAADVIDDQRRPLEQALAAHRADRPLPPPAPSWRVPPFELPAGPAR